MLRYQNETTFDFTQQQHVKSSCTTVTMLLRQAVVLT
jgi:hypothetical protein